MNPNENHMLLQLEHELRSLQPLPPDPTLLHRLDRALHDPVLDRAPASKKIVNFPKSTASPAAPAAPVSAGQNQLQWKPWAAVAACAAVATGAVAWKHNELKTLEAAVGKSNYIHSMNSKLQSLQPGALVVDPQRGPMRKVQVQFNNQQQFYDPSTNTKLEFHYPSVQEIFVIEPVQ